MESNNLNKIFSVSEYIAFLNAELKNYSAKVVGEVSEVNLGPTGHVYFRLKDDQDQSILRCVIYKSKYDLYGVEIKVGERIIAFGIPSIHKQYSFSFVAETIEYAGEGILKKEYEKLKKRLTEEGLFEVARKRPLPEYPHKIGVITALRGAVIADFSNNLGKFGFKVKMVDSRVEGQEAVSDLLFSIKTFKKEGIEVLVVMRGGGSLESLIAFNNEKLVREVASFPVPVIAAIGHHKDVPLVALAADIEVSTPSIAATRLSEPWEEAILFLEKHERDILNNYERALDNSHDLISQTVEVVREYSDLIINKYKDIENGVRVSFNNFKNALSNVRMNLRISIDKSFSWFKTVLTMANQQIEHAEKVVSFSNPERQLRLGYSIASYEGKIIKRVQDAKAGKNIDLRVTDGIITSEVKRINKNG